MPDELNSTADEGAGLSKRKEKSDLDMAILASRPTEEMLRERDKRNAAAARDLTGLIFGDPPKGYSALDRKGST